MTYLSIALLCLAIVPGSFSYNDIHTFMSPEEIQQVFNTDHDSVPEYEIAKVHWSARLRKRDLSEGHKMHIRAFGENINLWLNPGDPILVGENTPVYYAKYSPTKPSGVEFSRRDGLMAMVGKIFEDPATLASFVIGKEESGRTRVNGYVQSKNLAVRSLPTRVAEEYRRRRRSVDDSDDLNSPYHIIFKTNESVEENYPKLPVNVSALREKISQYNSGIPDTLYPEILVMVENSITKAYGNDVYGLLQYVMAFFNGVDLKYRSIEFPNFRMHIAGIILANDPEATPYISNYSLGENVFNSAKALPKSGEFFYAVKDDFPTDSYDVALTLTRQAFGKDGNEGVIGIAYTGAACKHFDGYWATSSVALVKDDGAFRNVIVAAHELGHSFGAPHDSAREGCKTEDGHIMTFTTWYTRNSSDFSDCSLKHFDEHLNEGKLDCLFNKPEVPGKSLPRLMPGRMKNLDEQCKSTGRISSCESPDVCVNMYCRREDGTCENTNEAASDGTRCGDNKFCLHMECVSL